MRRIAFMQKETSGNAIQDLQTLIAQLKQERGELRVRIHLARCGIREEWEKSETIWRRLHAISGASRDNARQLSQELKDSYVRIYRGLLTKSCLLLEQLNHIGQPTDAAALHDLKRQVVAELSATRLRLEKLGGAESPHALPEENPVCACLKCKSDRDERPLDLAQTLVESVNTIVQAR